MIEQREKRGATDVNRPERIIVAGRGSGVIHLACSSDTNGVERSAVTVLRCRPRLRRKMTIDTSRTKAIPLMVPPTMAATFGFW